jgi:hypothetical protein
MKHFVLFTAYCLMFGAALSFAPQNAVAQWTRLGNINGVQVYRDERTGMEWTQTIGQVQSSSWGTPALALVAKYGFRLPSFRELQIMEVNGGFRPLKINTAMQQYYETSNSSTLAAAWGNGFRTPQQRKGTGRNWVIGIRDPNQGEIGEPYFPPGDLTSSKPTSTTSPTTSKSSSPGVTTRPTAPSASSTQPSVDKPSSAVPVLPTLPSYD